MISPYRIRVPADNELGMGDVPGSVGWGSLSTVLSFPATCGVERQGREMFHGLLILLFFDILWWLKR